MKKLILFAIMILICAGLANAADYYFVVDDDGTAADVIDVINTIMDLKIKGELSEGEYEQYSNGELSIEDFNSKVGVFVYKGEATIIIGDLKHEDFADEVDDSLKKVADIDAEIIYSDELESENLIKTIEKYENKTEEDEEENTTEEPEPEQKINKTEEQETEKEENKTEKESFVEIKEEQPGIIERIINWIKSLFE